MRHSIERDGGTSTRIHSGSTRPMGRTRSCAPFYHPLAILVLQHILHGHSGRRRSISFGLKVYLCSGFIVMERDRGDADVHRQQVRALRQIGHDALPHRVLILNIFLAARQQNETHGRSREESQTNHISIIAAGGQTFLAPPNLMRYTNAVTPKEFRRQNPYACFLRNSRTTDSPRGRPMGGFSLFGPHSAACALLTVYVLLECCLTRMSIGD